MPPVKRINHDALYSIVALNCIVEFPALIHSVLFPFRSSAQRSSQLTSQFIRATYLSTNTTSLKAFGIFQLWFFVKRVVFKAGSITAENKNA